ncbi:MAG: hypothetical protein IJZ39_12390 [Oscillospiraceae bacterium]|nr:hypothetical protein [Oscillospiraceae bacterium]
MSYNNDGGCCNGGWGMPFGGFMNGMGGFGFDALILLLFFGLMGGGMWGGMGGWGGFGGGAGMLGTTSLAATETAALINQQNTADRVAGIGADVRQILGQTGGIIEAVNTVGNRAQDGFARVDTNLCQLGNNIAQQFSAQTMNGMQNHNNLTSQLTEMRFANQQCCCDTKQLIQSSFCDLRHQMAADKCETLGAIAASKAEILGVMNAQRMAELEAKNIELKGQISQANQTAAIVAAVQANGCKPACAPAPCGTAYAYTPCNPCYDGVQRAVNNALGERIGELLFPTTTPATA